MDEPQKYAQKKKVKVFTHPVHQTLRWKIAKKPKCLMQMMIYVFVIFLTWLEYSHGWTSHLDFNWLPDSFKKWDALICTCSRNDPIPMSLDVAFSPETLASCRRILDNAETREARERSQQESTVCYATTILGSQNYKKSGSNRQGLTPSSNFPFSKISTTDQFGIISKNY